MKVNDPRVVLAIGILVLVMWSTHAPADREGARRCLEAAGYTDIEFVRGRPLSRSQTDFYCTGFEATSPSGRHVSGYVTGGLLGGSALHVD
jgi:hypothetical protein